MRALRDALRESVLIPTVFFKIASKLDREELKESLVVSLVWVLQVFFSAMGAYALSRLVGLHKRGQYFVMAMAIFGNANSLPISLIVSLSKTLPNLRWHQRPNDSPDEIAARGIIYLIINQQLGQMLRWTYGYNTLLAPATNFTVAEGGPDTSENGLTERERRDWHESQSLLGESTSSLDRPESANGEGPPSNGILTSGTVTPNMGNGNHTSIRLTNGLRKPQSEEGVINWKSPKSIARGISYRVRSTWNAATNWIDRASWRAYNSLPPWLQKVANFLHSAGGHIKNQLNAPLVTTLFALFAVCVPAVKAFFFTKDTLVNTSITTAIEMSGNAAIPLTLFVLGSNLANTPSAEERLSIDPKLNKQLVVLSLISRMVLPVILAAPILALIAKYVSVSVVDDPTFVVVAFLLIGAPPALQMSQICQLNDVYVPAMAQLLFWGYVVL
jgi:choline kinase